MKPIIGLIRWLWRHTSRTTSKRINGIYVVDVVVEFCSSPTCTCGREKRVPPTLAVVRS